VHKSKGTRSLQHSVPVVDSVCLNSAAASRSDCDVWTADPGLQCLRTVYPGPGRFTYERCDPPDSSRVQVTAIPCHPSPHAHHCYISGPACDTPWRVCSKPRCQCACFERPLHSALLRARVGSRRSARYMDPTSRRQLPNGALRSSTDLRHTDKNKLSNLAERIFGFGAKKCEIKKTSYVHACTASTSRGMPLELTR
jgi:hypothetical protein